MAGFYQEARSEGQPTSDFLFELDGARVEDAEIYSSKRHVAYLEVMPELGAPLLGNLGNTAATGVELVDLVPEHTTWCRAR